MFEIGDFKIEGFTLKGHGKFYFFFWSQLS